MLQSQPTRAAWIEIAIISRTLSANSSQPTRAALIEIPALSVLKCRPGSQPTRAAWIEMAAVRRLALALLVAAHSGCVD